MEINNLGLPDRSIGKKLKKLRESKALSIEDVSNSTKIRVDFLKAIEEDNFSIFDSHVYLKGFIKNYAHFLGVESDQLVALYRRDYENINSSRKVNKPETQQINHSEKKSIKFVKDLKITKRKIIYTISALLIITIITSLFIFITTIFKSPKLNIYSPEQISNGEIRYIETDKKSIRIEGETEPNTLIKINEEPLSLKPGNTFQSDFLPLTSERNIVLIEATSPLGIKSNIQIEFIRTDLKDLSVETADAIISIKEKPVFMLIRSDGLIKFNDIAVPNEAINITADKFIEIESSEPQFISISINDQIFQLEKTFERFEFSENGIVRLST